MGGPAGSSADEFDSFESLVMAVIEIQHVGRENEPLKLQGMKKLQWITPWGQTALYSDDSTIQSFRTATESPKQKFATRYRTLVGKAGRTAEDYIREAEWELKHGLLKECKDMFEEAKTQATPGGRAQAQLAAYAAVKDGLARKFESPANSVWQKRLPGFGLLISPENHYAVFHNHKGL